MNTKEYFYRASGTCKIFKYTCVLLLVILFIFAFTVYSDEITYDNFRYLIKYADFDVFDDAKHSSFSFGKEENAAFALLREDFAVVTRNDFSLYDLSGKKNYTEHLRYSNPALLSNPEHCLVYDVFGNSFSVFNSFSPVLTEEFEYPIEYACISKGGFAFITGEKGYTSKVIVYNSKLSKSFRFLSKEKRVTDIALSDDAKTLLCAFTGVQDGHFVSSFTLFDTVAGEELCSGSIEEEMIVRSFLSDKKMFLITDKCAYAYYEDGALAFSVPFGVNNIYKAYVFDSELVLVYTSALSGNNTRTCVYDFSGKLVYEASDRKKFLGAAKSGSQIYLLYQGELLKISGSDYSVQTSTLPEEYHSVFSYDDGVVLCSDERVYTADFFAKEDAE